MNRSFWRDKRVFMTGHTGFKGGWLALWLTDMGAEVHGYALAPPTEPNLFTVTNLSSRLAHSTIADIRDFRSLADALDIAHPEVVFHLAAQPLVRLSYAEPLETYAVNVMGTANLLEAVRRTDGVKAVVNVTSDKCYENQEWLWPYRETEAMGGFDPYSSSKGCAELVSAAYRKSFLDQAGIQLATARAGNVIGGGDWAVDRLLPDFLRALDIGSPITLRAPGAVRPWQHVLEPLSGYLMLAERLLTHGRPFADAWNFGPDEVDCRSVQWLVDALCGLLPGATWRLDDAANPHEARLLRLDSSKARATLGWQPRWSLDTALTMTLAWHKAWRQSQVMSEVCLRQIHEYEALA